MVNLLRVLVVAVALYGFLPAARPAEAQKKDDVLHLKDGRIIRGTIVEQFPNSETLLIRLTDGTFERVAKADIERITQSAPLRQDKRYTRTKNPALAWFLSFALWGGGQFYNGDVEKGVGFAIPGVVASVLILSSHPNECALHDTCPQRTIGIVLGLGTWIFSQIDAPLSARAINTRVREGVSLDLRPAPHRLGVSLATLRF